MWMCLVLGCWSVCCSVQASWSWPGHGCASVQVQEQQQFKAAMAGGVYRQRTDVSRKEKSEMVRGKGSGAHEEVVDVGVPGRG